MQDAPDGDPRRGDPVRRALAALPQAGTSLVELHDQLLAEPPLDPVVLELCRHRTARLLGGEGPSRPVAVTGADGARALLDLLGRWTSSPAFTAPQRAALTFTEQFVLDAKHLEAEVAELRHHFSDVEIFSLTVAIGIFEGLQRLAGVVDGLSGETPGAHLGTG